MIALILAASLTPSIETLDRIAELQERQTSIDVRRRNGQVMRAAAAFGYAGSAGSLAFLGLQFFDGLRGGRQVVEPSALLIAAGISLGVAVLMHVVVSAYEQGLDGEQQQLDAEAELARFKRPDPEVPPSRCTPQTPCAL